MDIVLQICRILDTFLEVVGMHPCLRVLVRLEEGIEGNGRFIWTWCRLQETTRIELSPQSFAATITFKVDRTIGVMGHLMGVDRVPIVF